MPLPQNFNHRFLEHARNFCGSDDTVLWKTVEYALKAPGKRIRPVFVQEVSERVNLPKPVMEHLAFSIELVHLFLARVQFREICCRSLFGRRRGRFKSSLFGDFGSFASSCTKLTLRHWASSSLLKIG